MEKERTSERRAREREGRKEGRAVLFFAFVRRARRARLDCSVWMAVEGE